MRRLIGALLRRMAERVDPKPRPVITINSTLLGNCNGDLGAQIAAELKRHGRLNGTGLA